MLTLEYVEGRQVQDLSQLERALDPLPRRQPLLGIQVNALRFWGRIAQGHLRNLPSAFKPRTGKPTISWFLLDAETCAATGTPSANRTREPLSVECTNANRCIPRGPFGSWENPFTLVRRPDYHEGCASKYELLVSRRRPDPSRRTIQISRFLIICATPDSSVVGEA